MLITHSWKLTPGPEVEFYCPRCDAYVPADTSEYKEKTGLYFIPLIILKEVRVECAHCRLLRVTRLPLDDIAKYSADDLQPHLRQRTSIVVNCLAIASLLTFWAPVIAQVVGGIALLGSYKAGGWQMWASMIGLVLSLVVLAIFVLALVLS